LIFLTFVVKRIIITVVKMVTKGSRTHAKRTTLNHLRTWKKLSSFYFVGSIVTGVSLCYLHWLIWYKCRPFKIGLTP